LEPRVVVLNGCIFEELVRVNPQMAKAGVVGHSAIHALGNMMDMFRHMEGGSLRRENELDYDTLFVIDVFANVVPRFQYRNVPVSCGTSDLNIPMSGPVRAHIQGLHHSNKPKWSL